MASFGLIALYYCKANESAPGRPLCVEALRFQSFGFVAAVAAAFVVVVGAAWCLGVYVARVRRTAAVTSYEVAHDFGRLW